MVIDLGRQALWTMLLVAAPMLGFGLVVGLLVSILQAVTQINEMTLTFVPKIVAVSVALILFLPWIIRVMVTYTARVFAMVGGL